MPEPHILLTVVAATDRGRPALRAAWRAGAWPRPAGRTQPIRICSISSGETPDRSTAAFTAAAPSSVALTEPSAPWNPPMGVRA